MNDSVVVGHAGDFDRCATRTRPYISLCRIGGGRCSESEPLSLCLVKPLVSPGGGRGGVVGEEMMGKEVEEEEEEEEEI